MLADKRFSENVARGKDFVAMEMGEFMINCIVGGPLDEVAMGELVWG